MTFRNSFRANTIDSCTPFFSSYLNSNFVWALFSNTGRMLLVVLASFVVVIREERSPMIVAQITDLHLLEAFVGHLESSPSGFVQYTIDDYPVRLIALDTLIEEREDGLVCSE